ncbi:MAG TPA: M42 family metallopeptidase [Thermoleophilia bacterium]|nr:M42 family metallopeptidase [Demequina sp.]HZK48033.1 M42 family metallopeptidase [Thermoleophilia bacterium]
MKDIERLLRLFADAHGVSGHEGAVASLLVAELEPLVDEVSTDAMGNVVGTKTGPGPSIMIAAHMDEIGFMVKYIDESGFLRFVPLGGWFDQMVLGQRVLVHGTKGALTGVIGAKPPHIMDDEERKKIVKIKEMFIDIGAIDADDAAALGVEIGSPVTLDRTMATLANGFVTGKSFDNRAGVVMMIAAMQRLKGKKCKATVHAVGTVQEEVGLKGARTSAFSLDPDAAIIADVTVPGDHPGVTKEQRHVMTGKGPVLTVVDSDGRGVIVPKKILNWLRESADSAKIPYQLDVGSGGTTDATAIHLTKKGVPSGVVSIATRYIHAPIEVLSLKDIDQGADLLVQALLSAHKHL